MDGFENSPQNMTLLKNIDNGLLLFFCLVTFNILLKKYNAISMNTIDVTWCYHGIIFGGFDLYNQKTAERCV